MSTFQELLDLQCILQMQRTAEIRYISAQYYKEISLSLSLDKILSFCRQLLEKRTWAHSLIAYDWAFRCKKQYNEDTFSIFEDWLHKYVHDWGDCDDFCSHAFGELLCQFPQLFSKIIPWTKSKDFWIRRAAAVILIYPLKRRVFSHKEVIRICNALMTDKHHLVQKGTGWLLKEYSMISSQIVYDYLKKNISRMPRITFRYALGKLGQNERIELMSLQRRK